MARKSKDIIERLKSHTGCDSECQGLCRECPDDVRDSAIAEIARLRTQLAITDKALEPFAEFASAVKKVEAEIGPLEDSEPVEVRASSLIGTVFPLRFFRRAAQALSPNTTEAKDVQS